MNRSSRRPSIALVVALLALFVALGGTAVAAGPVVKRALFADNAGKLQGKTAAALVQQAVSEAVPKAAQEAGPASTAKDVITVKTQNDSIPPNDGKLVVVSCDGGKKVVAGGYSSSGAVLSLGSSPSGDASWQFMLVNASDTAAANLTLSAVCIA